MTRPSVRRRRRDRPREAAAAAPAVLQPAPPVPRITWLSVLPEVLRLYGQDLSLYLAIGTVLQLPLAIALMVLPVPEVATVNLLAVPIGGAAIMYAAGQRQAGREVGIVSAYVDTSPRLLKILLFGLLVAVAGVVGQMIFGVVYAGVLFLVLAAYLGVRLFAVVPALLFEADGIGAAVQRSWRLVAGRWRRAALPLAVLAIVEVAGISGLVLANWGAQAGGSALGLPESVLWVALLVPGLGVPLLIYPVSALGVYLLYLDFVSPAGSP